MPNLSLNLTQGNPVKPPITRLVVGFLIAILLVTGCDDKPPQRLSIKESPTSKENLRSYPCSVLLVGDESLKQSLQRQWSARHDSEFSITNVSEQEFSADNFVIENGIDVIIYPSHLMIELIHRHRIVQLDDAIYQSESFDKQDILSHFRKSGIRYDSKPWAVPCGGPMFALLYSPSALATTKTAVPKTWNQLIRWAEKLQTISDSDVPTKVALPLTEGWAATTFLAVSAPYIRHKGSLSVLFERRSMKPLIESEAFVKSLNELKRLAELNPDCLQQTPADILQDLLDGKIAAGVTWPTVAVSPSQDKEIAAELMISSLPGSKTYFDDSRNNWGTRQSGESNVVDLHGFNSLLASQTKVCRRPQSASQFLKWIPETEISKVLFAGNKQLGPFRETHLGDLDPWLGDHYSLDFEKSFSENLKAAHEKSLIMTLPIILNQQEYLNVLDREIRECLKSDRLAEECLADVAKQWEKLTDSIGRKKQSNILRRNSNY